MSVASREHQLEPQIEGCRGKRSRRQPSCAHDSAVALKEKGSKMSKRSRISGPYIPYGLFQTKGETCAKFCSDRFRNVDLYKVQTYKQTNKQIFIFIYKILAQYSIIFHFNHILTKLEYSIQQYPSNVNNWDPNRTPKTR